MSRAVRRAELVLAGILLAVVLLIQVAGSVKQENPDAEPRDIASFFSVFESFVQRNLLNPDLTRKLRVFIEEVLSQLADAARRGGNGLHVSVEYMEKENRGKVEISWEGEAFNPLEAGDEISDLLIRHSCPEASWSREGNRNLISGTIG